MAEHKTKDRTVTADVDKDTEKAIARLARTAIEDSLDSIDDQDLSRLKTARMAALEQLDAGKKFPFFAHRNQWVPAGAFALAMAWVVAIWLDKSTIENEEPTPLLADGGLPNHIMNSTPDNETNSINARDNALIANNDAWQEEEELLDNLEFITWLTIEDEFAG